MTDRKKIMTIFGTRPEATKMGPVVKALKKRDDWFDTRVVVTGQHREQLFHALEAFSITPDVNLDIMQEQQSLAYIFSASLTGLDDVIKAEKPDMILVHGDTQTTISAALAACYNKVPLGHVEAGLRSYVKLNPWPEEINRVLTDAVADVLLAPTPSNRDNLLKAGASPEQIFITGQTQIDAAMAIYQPDYRFREAVLNELDFVNHRIILATAHRRENYGQPMTNMFKAMRRIVDAYPDVIMVYPVHLSPIVQEAARSLLGDHPRIMLLAPLEYREMINLIARSHMVLSDSGGLQEECPVFDKPLVLMRETTERPEGINAGVTVLSGTREEDIYHHTRHLMDDREAFETMARARNPFGDGKAAERITGVLAYYFGLQPEPPGEFVP